MTKLQKVGGVAALCEALIYITVFGLYGTVLAAPANLTSAQKLALLADKQDWLFAANLLGYVVFGILLALLVLALHERLKQAASTLTQLASMFGVLWVGLVIASGMVANIGLKAVLKLGATEPEPARALWRAISTVVEGLGGGNEIVGGIWVLLVSLAALKSGCLPKALNYLGVVVGTFGVATVYPAEILTELFGVSQIIWFGYLAFAMLWFQRASSVPVPRLQT